MSHIDVSLTIPTIELTRSIIQEPSGECTHNGHLNEPQFKNATLISKKLATLLLYRFNLNDRYVVWPRDPNTTSFATIATVTRQKMTHMHCTHLSFPCRIFCVITEKCLWEKIAKSRACNWAAFGMRTRAASI